MNKWAKARPLVFFLASLLLAMLLFFLLYRYDNKYISAAPSPISGLLILDEHSLGENPLLFPAQEWEFYPGALLTPEDLEAGSLGYRRFVMIGQFSGFNMGRHDISRQGQGSYRLKISIPTEERGYAIELPEVFSACRMYINGRPVLELGEAQEARYRPEMQNRVITFTAQDSIDILLAASNYSHYTGGFTYPPAFGEPSAVLEAREARLLLRASFCFLALFTAAFSLWAGLGLRWGRGLHFSLLSLCFIGVSAYPLLYSFFAAGVQPWTTLEITCYYAMFPLIVSLNNSLCGVKGRAALLSQSVLWGFCLFALVYGLCASLAGTLLVNVFSALSAVIKLLMAFWLLASSLKALKEQEHRSAAMLIGAAVYSAALLADRLWPLYEPIYGGFFGELGAAALLIALASMLWGDFVEAYRFRSSYAERQRLLTQQLELQSAHYGRLVEQIEHTRFLRHDFRHHMRAISSLAHSGANSDLLEYLERLEPSLLPAEPLSYSNNHTADAILQHFTARAEGAGVKPEIHVELPADIPFSDDELCVVLGNLLENAAEALERQHSGERFLYLRVQCSEGRLAILLENSFNGRLSQRGERFYSSKRDDFGIGIESVRAIVQRHGGFCSFEAQGCRFRASVLIPTKDAK